MSRPCQTDAKNDVKDYQIITPRENAVRKYLSFPPYVFKFQVRLWPKFVSVLEPKVTPNVRLGSFFFSSPSHFCMCMWNFVCGNKAEIGLFTPTKVTI